MSKFIVNTVVADIYLNTRGVYTFWEFRVCQRCNGREVKSTIIHIGSFSTRRAKSIKYVIFISRSPFFLLPVSNHLRIIGISGIPLGTHMCMYNLLKEKFMHFYELGNAHRKQFSQKSIFYFFIIVRHYA